MRHLLLVFVHQFHAAGALALRQSLLIALQHFILHLGLAVASLSLLLHTTYAALDGL